jgi:basic amino acid/polyamine antiporter, APA family
VSYLFTLPIEAIQRAPADRVATATVDVIAPGWGSVLMAIAIMVSTFGCVNSLVLSGPRVYFAMAQDGLFLRSAAKLNRASVPGASLFVQGLWASLLVLPRIFDPATGQYGNLYSNLLDYVISAALIFYILTICAVFRFRFLRPGAERPYRIPGYPIVPLIYILGASMILWSLFTYRAASTWPGLLIIAIGIPVYVGIRIRSKRLSR